MYVHIACNHIALLQSLSWITILFHAVVTISFNPQNYTVPEGSSVVLMIVLDRVSPQDITVSVTTMDITAECEQHMKQSQLR